MSDTTDSDADRLLSPGEWARLKRANIAHLVDLKRQGYSPRFTELVVDRKTDRIVALPERRPRRSPKPIVQVAMLRHRT